MTAIGGIFNMDGACCDGETLVKMSRGMLSRGREEREAAVFEGGGLFWSCDRDERVLAEIGERMLVCDGCVTCGTGDVGARFFGESDAELCLDALGGQGMSFFECLRGEYAIAAYDRRKKELILLRDGMGARPLYYARKGNSVGFASEIKGLLPFLDSPAAVLRERLCAQILSRGGQYNGAELFRDIRQVPKGGGCVISRLGIAPFEYAACRNDTETEEDSGRLSSELACPDEEGLFHMLCEILYAFDYPEFDCLMPCFLRDIRRARECGGVVVDGSLCCDIGYSVERRDRLSVLAGYRPRCVPPKTYTVKDRELRKMERIMSAVLAETDRNTLEYLLGRNIEREIKGEGNIARRIRYMGMAVQSVIWYERREIAFI